MARFVVDVYPVGVLSGLILDWRFRQHRPLWKAERTRQELGYVWRRLLRAEWRCAKNAFNGYLAEPTPIPAGLKRFGSGWTKKRAIRRLAREIGNSGSPVDAGS